MIDWKKKSLILGAIVIVVAIIWILIGYFTKGTLEITSNPPGALITINKSEFKAPRTIKIKRGKYLVNAFLENYPPQTKTVTIEARRKTSLSFDLTQTGPSTDEPLEFSADDPVFTLKEHFSVSLPQASEEKEYDLVVALFATLNAGVNGPPIEEQLEAYNQELKIYKKEALDWLGENNVNPETYRIKWVPEEAANI